MIKHELKLTPSETRILLLLKDGAANKTISDKTETSINTVKFHLKKIFKKLGARNRVEAVNKFNSIHLKTHTP